MRLLLYSPVQLPILGRGRHQMRIATSVAVSRRASQRATAAKYGVLGVNPRMIALTREIRAVAFW